MSPLLLLTLCATPPQVVGSVRPPLVLLVMTPKQVSVRRPTAALIAAAKAAVEARTGLYLTSSEQAGLDEAALRQCGFRERLSCWTRLVRDAQPTAPLLLVVTIHPDRDDHDRVATQLIDLEEADAIQRDADRSDPDWAQSIEDRLFERSVRTDLTQVERGSLEAFLLRLFDGPMRGTLEAKKVWGALGQIDLQGHGDTGEVLLDGRSLGVRAVEALRVIDVPAGTHTVEVRRSDETQRFEVQVEAGSSALLRLPAPAAAPSPLRHGLRWTGVGVGTAGVAMLIAAAVMSDDDVAGYCLKRETEAADCNGVGGVSFRYDGGATPTTSTDALDPGAVPVLAVGTALIALGVTWAATAFLFGEEEDAPWWSMALGVALGGAAGLSAAALSGL